ncbi:phosphotransferase family protein [Pseudotabrizicola algicola]|uniref:Phosphotransferase family protein n=1 Tax=Pseudotabrizicola algicola TaxID=2709381 RepID=A0A6B3RTF7_9RHOB|nr:phosphotransferase family protein [Pseudotabrizicola algicola]NEX46342.1 phosphotransferase family protein [Pseudotabrizicola algicola]
MQDDIAAIIADIPALAGWQGKAERLGGLTNRVYRLGDAILRVPGEGTADYIDRAAEAVAAEAAAKAGVSPTVLYNSPAKGIMVTRYIDGTTTMTPQAFRSRPGAPARAAHALRQLHHSGQTFPTRFELFAMIDDYLRLLSGKDVTLPQGYHAVVAEAGAVRSALARNPAPLVPCHCDPLCENFLDTGTRMWIVDWEYAGMNDPMWDLGDLSVEAEFDAAQDTELLAAYFNGPAPPQDAARMVIYKAMCDLLWTLWGLIQLANGNPADDFQAYADTRFARCRALMATPDFARHLATLQAS